MKLKKIGNTEKKVYDIAKPLADELGLILWDVRFEKEGAAWYLRVFIDKEDGITIDDCESLTRPLNELLDELDPIPQSYFLEVGSAGLERELIREEHFNASLNKKVTIRLIRAVDGIKETVGTLTLFDKEKITVMADDNTTKDFLLADIAHIKLFDDFEF